MRSVQGDTHVVWDYLNFEVPPAQLLFQFFQSQVGSATIKSKSTKPSPKPQVTLCASGIEKGLNLARRPGQEVVKLVSRLVHFLS